jgi:uncharacterized protein YndB with AHSA1/START domain
MSNPDYVYTTYIRSTPQKVWDAITNPEFQKQYFGHALASDWKPGSSWRSENPTMQLRGKVLEAHAPEKLVFTWAESDKPELGTSTVTYEIAQVGDTVRLMVLHGELTPGMAARISTGWPRVLSSMKSLLETGSGLNMSTLKKGDCAA